MHELQHCAIATLGRHSATGARASEILSDGDAFSAAHLIRGLRDGRVDVLDFTQLRMQRWVLAVVAPPAVAMPAPAKRPAPAYTAASLSNQLQLDDELFSNHVSSHMATPLAMHYLAGTHLVRTLSTTAEAID